jgi:cell division protease FtsH
MTNKNEKKPQKPKNFQHFIIWGVVIFVLFAMLSGSENKAKKLAYPEVAYSDFLQESTIGNVADITITGNDIYGNRADGSKFYTYIPGYTDVVTDTKGHNLTIQGKPVDDSPTLGSIFFSLLPILVLIAFWVFFMKKIIRFRKVRE